MLVFPEDLLDGLSGFLNVAPWIAGLAILVLVLGWFHRSQKDRLEREWLVSWNEVTELARQERVPFTAEDTIAAIRDRIKEAREEKMRGKFGRRGRG